MAPDRRLLRLVRSGSALVALLVAVGFAALIVALPNPSILLHEVAGLILLVLIATALTAAIRLRSDEPRPVGRLAAALVVLVVVGLTGAMLATGAIPPGLAALPLVGLLALGLLLADSVRVPKAG